jgi:threonine dehydratase
MHVHGGAVDGGRVVRHGLQHASSHSGRLEVMRIVAQPETVHLEAAWDEVRRTLPVTPVVAAPQLGPDVWLKLETLQPTGSFKVSGGLAAVAATLRADPGRAVIGSSAGNHGLGLAYAASVLGATVTVIVPRLASAAKVSAIQQFDVRLVLHGEGYGEAEAHALDLAAQDGSRYVSPYNDPDVIAGQATIARELLEQVPNLGTVVVPSGGGGLLAGMSIGLAGTGVRVIGIESEASPSMSAALASGGIVPITVEPTLADGLAGNFEAGAVTVDIALGHRVEVRTVSEADIRSAMAFSIYKMGLVLEGAGAVGVAALRAGVLGPDPDGKATVVLLTGRNVAPALLEEVLRA